MILVCAIPDPAVQFALKSNLRALSLSPSPNPQPQPRDTQVAAADTLLRCQRSKRLRRQDTTCSHHRNSRMVKDRDGPL